jgi:GT2 family glycosyltransferase
MYVQTPGGLPAELMNLSLDEACRHLDNYIGNFLLDGAVTSVYLNRLAADDKLAENPAALSCLSYLLRKYIQIEPFEKNGLGMAQHFVKDARIAPLLDFLHKISSVPNTDLERGDNHWQNSRLDEARRSFLRVLTRHPAHLLAADRLLRIDMAEGKAPGEWSRTFNCHGPAKEFWTRKLFQAHARVNRVEDALALWQDMNEKDQDELTLNLAAEVFVKAGDRAKAARLYAASLRLDPMQDPVRRRLEQLSSPFVANPQLVVERSVNIYLYTWNKADMFGRTLQSLAASDIGGASIKILLNGCTDHSRDVAHRTHEMFPNNPVEIIELPVNVGAPAARNWLIAQPDTRQADYTAFLDDDVDVPRDWLAHYLTVAESTPKFGAVGCKVLFPEEPRRFQYLFRNISVAKEGFVRISLVTPNNQVDNGVYDFVRPTDNVMGCLHMFSREALQAHPRFDIRFSPSQLDDISHDIDLRLDGFAVVYTGLVECIHHQSSGVGIHSRKDLAKIGNVIGNDVKLAFKYLDRLDQIGALRNPPSLLARERVQQFTARVEQSAASA